MRVTVGQLLLNEALPEELRDYKRVYDKKTTKAVLRAVADKYPERYKDIVQRFHEIGMDAATETGKLASLSLDSFRIGPKTARKRLALRTKVNDIINDPSLDDTERNKRIVNTLTGAIEDIQETNFQEALESDNPFAYQVVSGSRGNKSQLKALNVGDLVVSDHRGEPVPLPILNSYSDGLDPVEYWAAAYGARKGEIDKKHSTPKAGFLSKQLAMAAHRMLVTERDCGTDNGIPVDAGDPDNEGALLAKGYGNNERNSIITPKLMRSLKRHKTILVRSPMTCQAKSGICQKCAGLRERGGFPPIGDNIGIAAAQAIAEPLTQAQISSKHTAGAIGGESSAVSGFDLINQLVQVPKTFKGAAAISTLDGRVDSIDNAPQGGKYVTVKGVQHWVAPDKDIKIKAGDVVEAGDILSDGIPNPAEIAKHKGIGAGRWYFSRIFLEALNKNGVPSHRRNVELLARGLINHVRVTDLDGPADTIPDDVMEYDNLVRNYQPRYGFRTMTPKRAKGLFLEKPIMQYSIGTRVTKRVADDLKKHGIQQVTAHADPPSFVPEMVRAMDVLNHSDDWMVRLGGFGLKRTLLSSVHRGIGSEAHGTSFIPSLAEGTQFGEPIEQGAY